MKIFPLFKAVLIVLFCYPFLFDVDFFLYIDCNKVMQEDKWLGALC